MQNKKILIISPYFYPARSYGGIPRVMFDLAKEFVKDGYEVECATTDVLDNKHRHDKTYEEVDGIKIHYFKNVSNQLVVKYKFPIPIGYKAWLEKNIHRFDIVHIADFRNLCSYYAYKICKKHNIPFIVSPFGTVPYTRDFKWIIKKIFDLSWSKKMLKDAKYVTVQTNDELKEVHNFWIAKGKIKLIPLMIEYEKFRGLPVKWQIRKKYGISTDAKVLLFVWRIHKVKATDMMLEVFEEYNKIYDDSVLLIVWRDDGYEEHLKQLSKDLSIEKKVIFAGPVYAPENLKYYVDSDIYFMAPSHYEQTSTSSLEALACGIPVVVTEQADIPFIDEYNAWKIVKYDKKTILNALINVTEKQSNPADCTWLIKDHFDVRSIKDEFLKIYFG